MMAERGFCLAGVSRDLLWQLLDVSAVAHMFL